MTLPESPAVVTCEYEARLRAVEHELTPYWDKLEKRCHQNFERILEGYLSHGLAEIHFASVTGYGHNDLGREVTDKIFAHALQAESALVRMQMVSGTHAIALALQAALSTSPGGIISLTGSPYDTLEEVIGIRGESPASLMARGYSYQQLELFEGDTIRLSWTPEEQESVRQASVAFIQRSRGYSSRPSLAVADIEELVQQAKNLNPEIVVVVDNCYGEFVETREPTAVGADLIAGSLIKNPGGGLVPTGGYVAGRHHLVEVAAEFLTAPGIGSEGGYTFESTRTILQGLYFAPTVVKEALKGMSLAATVFHQLGYRVYPNDPAKQADIIQMIELQDKDKVLSFCRTLQSVSPVDSRLTPVPAVTPGYADAVVMAGGTFIFGSTIELSADAPMRPPYAVFLQGGLTYSHVRFAIKRILMQLDKLNLN